MWNWFWIGSWNNKGWQPQAKPGDGFPQPLPSPKPSASRLPPIDDFDFGLLCIHFIHALNRIVNLFGAQHTDGHGVHEIRVADKLERCVFSLR